MQRIESTWLGLATLGIFTFGCNDDAPSGDEVGEDSTTLEITTADDETTDPGTTESTTGADDDSADTTETTAADSTDTTTGNGDFELLEAAFADDHATLVLTFSDAVAPVEGVAPSDFRISMAITTSYEYMGASYELSYYSDPNQYVDEYAPAIGMMAITNGPDPDQISLALDPAFDIEACAELEYVIAHAQVPEVEGHFFPHYAPGNIPLTSEGGTALGPIGPDWVLSESLYVENAGWPNLDPQVPIPCP